MKPSLTLLFTVSAALAAAMPEHLYEYEEPFAIVRRGSWDRDFRLDDAPKESAPHLPAHLAAKIPERHHAMAAKAYQQVEEEDGKARQAHFAKLIAKGKAARERQEAGRAGGAEGKSGRAGRKPSGAEGKIIGPGGKSSGAGGRSSGTGGRSSGAEGKSGMSSLAQSTMGKTSARRGRGSA